MEKNKRNTLTVRLDDNDWTKFRETYNLKYSTTLRELVNLYSTNFKEKDRDLSVPERVRVVLGRACR